MFLIVMNGREAYSVSTGVVHLFQKKEDAEHFTMQLKDDKIEIVEYENDQIIKICKLINVNYTIINDNPRESTL
jgi:hypothetical protein